MKIKGIRKAKISFLMYFNISVIPFVTIFLIKAYKLIFLLYIYSFYRSNSTLLRCQCYHLSDSVGYY